MNLIIPDIPLKDAHSHVSSCSNSWREIVMHWRDGDPAHGLFTPLKDWHKDWLQGPNKALYAQKYYNHRIIALEFLKQYNSNEAAFLAAYPEAKHGHSALLAAINAARMLRNECITRKH